MYAHEKFASRPTLDIDFLGAGISNDGGNIVSAFREICSVDCPEDGVAFDVEHISSENITEQKDYHGIRLHIPVAMDTISQHYLSYLSEHLDLIYDTYGNDHSSLELPNKIGLLLL